LSKSNEILTANVSWNRVQTVQILWKSRKGYAIAGHLYSTFWANLSKNFSFVVLYPYRCTDGVKFGMEEGTFSPLLHAKRSHSINRKFIQVMYKTFIQLAGVHVWTPLLGCCISWIHRSCMNGCSRSMC